jgi:hypothetical protein
MAETEDVEPICYRPIGMVLSPFNRLAGLQAKADQRFEQS